MLRIVIARIAVITAIALVLFAGVFYTPSATQAPSTLNDEPTIIAPDHITPEPRVKQEPESLPEDIEKIIPPLPKPEEGAALSLPECNGQRFTVTPVDLNDVYEISPLGNLNPPDHTIPTEHMYFHIGPGGTATVKTSVRAPGDVFLLEVLADPQGDFSIRFALCKEVFGYYNHVKTLSDEVKGLIEDVECEKWTQNPGNLCSKRLLHKVDAGTVLGEVGAPQGNFDFGAFDFRTILDYANPSRYGEVGRARSLHIVCPIDLYDDETKKTLYDKVARSDGPKCGIVMQDIPGTLQGNWFQGDLEASSDWTNHLAFVHDNEDPLKSVISIGGFFTNAGKWEFEAESSGLINREFSDVKSDGSIYCYDLNQSGRLLVQLISDTELRIESQSGSCSGSVSFVDPAAYAR